MIAYNNLVKDVMDNGIQLPNRTGIDAITKPGVMFQQDMRTGFPAVTTKQLYFGQVKGELLGFIRGVDTAEGFRRLGCKVWDLNSKADYWVNNIEYKDTVKNMAIPEEDGYLGRIYGVQWRTWRNPYSNTLKGLFVDQLQNLLDNLRKDPSSRRHMVTAWNPSDLPCMALPPCHFAWQVMVDEGNKLMHLTWYQRSCDVFLGLPFNIASYGLLLEMLAHHLGYKTGTLTGFLSDTHIYVNHLDQVKEQLSRDPLPLPSLKLNYEPEREIYTVEPTEISLVNYLHHPAIKAEMAV